LLLVFSRICNFFFPSLCYPTEQFSSWESLPSKRWFPPRPAHYEYSICPLFLVARASFSLYCTSPPPPPLPSRSRVSIGARPLSVDTFIGGQTPGENPQSPLRAPKLRAKPSPFPLVFWTLAPPTKIVIFFYQKEFRATAFRFPSPYVSPQTHVHSIVANKLFFFPRVIKL